MLEATPSRSRLAGPRADQTMAAQHRVRCAGRHVHALVSAQHVCDLATAPGCVLAANGNHLGFQLSRGARGRAVRAARAVFQIITGKPLVACLAADLEASAQLADVRARLASQTDKFISLIPHGDFTPRQGSTLAD